MYVYVLATLRGDIQFKLTDDDYQLPIDAPAQNPCISRSSLWDLNASDNSVSSSVLISANVTCMYNLSITLPQHAGFA